MFYVFTIEPGRYQPVLSTVSRVPYYSVGISSAGITCRTVLPLLSELLRRGCLVAHDAGAGPRANPFERKAATAVAAVAVWVLTPTLLDHERCPEVVQAIDDDGQMRHTLHPLGDSVLDEVDRVEGLEEIFNRTRCGPALELPKVLICQDVLLEFVLHGCTD